MFVTPFGKTQFGGSIVGEKILVVDDEKEIADLIEVYLKNDGYTVYKY